MSWEDRVDQSVYTSRVIALVGEGVAASVEELDRPLNQDAVRGQLHARFEGDELLSNYFYRVTTDGFLVGESGVDGVAGTSDDLLQYWVLEQLSQ